MLRLLPRAGVSRGPRAQFCSLWTLCPPGWQADAYPLDHQGRPSRESSQLWSRVPHVPRLRSGAVLLPLWLLCVPLLVSLFVAMTSLLKVLSGKYVMELLTLCISLGRKQLVNIQGKVCSLRPCVWKRPRGCSAAFNVCHYCHFCKRGIQTQARKVINSACKGKPETV